MTQVRSGASEEHLAKEAVVTKLPWEEFCNYTVEEAPEPCLRHWDHQVVVLGGVDHCGACGAVVGPSEEVERQLAHWYKVKVALGLVSEEAQQFSAAREKLKGRG